MLPLQQSRTRMYRVLIQVLLRYNNECSSVNGTKILYFMTSKPITYYMVNKNRRTTDTRTRYIHTYVCVCEYYVYVFSRTHNTQRPISELIIINTIIVSVVFIHFRMTGHSGMCATSVAAQIHRLGRL
ncbi:Uncharacterized protein FWK35_00020405 [Aphis craccivora]|uniref:Uncharacterized protein n=1 Tax=Aphis craccivora TaxID=307492 RepID=A0A6G0YXA6_APHCR|nr:Uncharacterized protein FWK35_00020405 [Aphis craccivora]